MGKFGRVVTLKFSKSVKYAAANEAAGNHFLNDHLSRNVSWNQNVHLSLSVNLNSDVHTSPGVYSSPNAHLSLNVNLSPGARLNLDANSNPNAHKNRRSGVSAGVGLGADLGKLSARDG